MNDLQALKFKLSLSKNIFDVIVVAKEWRDLLVAKSGVELRSYQVPLSDKMIEYTISRGGLGSEIISLWCRQSGKTETVSDTVLALGTFFNIFLDQHFKAGLFAPVESMITHVTRNRLRNRYRNVRNYLRSVSGIRQIAGEGETSSLFVLRNCSNDKEFTARSLSVGDTAEIIGPTFDLVIVEQSELVNAIKLKNDVFPMGATTGGIRVLTGTTSPFFRNQYFKDAIQRWNPVLKQNKSTADYVDLVKWDEAARVSSEYRRYVQKEREKFGPDSIEFRTQFNLEWVEATLKFISWEDLIALEQDYIFDIERLRFFGIDVARAGDSTVVTVIEVNGDQIHILGWLELEGLDFEIQLPKIINFLRPYAPLRYGLVDIVGLGRPLFDMLKKQFVDETKDVAGNIQKVRWGRIEDFYGSVEDNDSMFKAMDREFVHDRVHYPKHYADSRLKARFIDQMIDLERHYDGFRLKLAAPKGKDRHDDYPSSLALALYAFKEKSFKTGVISL